MPPMSTKTWPDPKEAPCDRCGTTTTVELLRISWHDNEFFQHHTKEEWVCAACIEKARASAVKIFQ